MRWCWGVVLSVCVAGAGFANETELVVQMQAMREQMRKMADRLEAQETKIESQAHTINQLKGTHAAIAVNADGLARAEALRREDPKKDDKPNDSLRRSWELPAITVEGKRTSGLREEERIGSYEQPRWTARRRFAETRTYVIPEGEFEFEYWNIVKVARDGSDTKVETKYEAEIGLGHRLQLDIYGITHSEGNQKGFGFDEQDVEIRYAFADWGVIPGNPTMYAEYKFLNDEADHYEFKLLFGDETPVKGLHWSANGVFEHAMGDAQTNSYELTGGLSYTIKDEKFSVGLEAKLAFEDDKFDRGLHKPEFLLGPSFQISPLKQLHIDFAPLIGFTEQSPALKSLLIIGWEF